MIKNDTVIGDPLLTVPLLVIRDDTYDASNELSLCYEIHGAAFKDFNLISDSCTSVNSYYTPMNDPDHGNIISKIGVVAVNRENQCVNIEVDLNGCAAKFNGETILMFKTEHGISVMKSSKTVRIVVPNCVSQDLIFWVYCQNISGQEMIKFVVSRGFNLRPTSHGLLGKSRRTSLY